MIMTKHIQNAVLEEKNRNFWRKAQQLASRMSLVISADFVVRHLHSGEPLDLGPCCVDHRFQMTAARIVRKAKPSSRQRKLAETGESFRN